MPFFDLKTNFKDVPAEFNKETTDLIANLLGKPNSNAWQAQTESSHFRYFQAPRAKLNYFSGALY